MKKNAVRDRKIIIRAERETERGQEWIEKVSLVEGKHRKRRGRERVEDLRV